MIAIRKSASPVVTSQASIASMSASATPTEPWMVCPVLWQPHCRLKYWSLGVWALRWTQFGSAYSTWGLRTSIAVSTSMRRSISSRPSTVT